MILSTAIDLYAGGIGSGCRGPNCGRPRTAADLKHLVDKYANRYGARRLIMRESALYQWYNCEYRKNCDDAKLSAAARLWREAGLNSSHAEDHLNLMDEWVGAPDERLAELAQKVVAGKVNSEPARALALESLVNAKVLGDRKYITLYRGVGGSYGRKAMQQALQSNHDIVLKGRGADSWSDDKDSAHDFGNVVLSARVPVQYVMASHRSNPKLNEAGESEFIVAFPKGRIPVDRKHVGVELDAEASKSEPVEIDLTSDEEFHWMRRKNKKGKYAVRTTRATNPAVGVREKETLGRGKWH